MTRNIHSIDVDYDSFVQITKCLSKLSIKHRGDHDVENYFSQMRDLINLTLDVYTLESKYLLYIRFGENGSAMEWTSDMSHFVGTLFPKFDIERNMSSNFLAITKSSDKKNLDVWKDAEIKYIREKLVEYLKYGNSKKILRNGKINELTK